MSPIFKGPEDAIGEDGTGIPPSGKALTMLSTNQTNTMTRYHFPHPTVALKTKNFKRILTDNAGKRVRRTEREAQATLSSPPVGVAFLRLAGRKSMRQTNLYTAAISSYLQSFFGITFRISKLLLSDTYGKNRAKAPKYKRHR